MAQLPPSQLAPPCTPTHSCSLTPPYRLCCVPMLLGCPSPSLPLGKQGKPKPTKSQSKRGPGVSSCCCRVEAELGGPLAPALGIEFSAVGVPLGGGIGGLAVYLLSDVSSQTVARCSCTVPSTPGRTLAAFQVQGKQE